MIANEVRTKRPQHYWSDEEKEYLKEIVTGRGYKEIQQMMSDKFKYKFTLEQIKAAIGRYELKTGLNGYFKRGNPPWNKGMKGLNIGGTHTQFKKGHIPANHRDVGSERVTVDGYTEVKVAEPNKWKLKHRIIYEEYHNTKLTRKDLIIFLDGNKGNFDIKNLEKVTRSELAIMNKNNLIKEDSELTRAGLNIIKIMAKCKEREV